MTGVLQQRADLRALRRGPANKVDGAHRAYSVSQTAHHAVSTHAVAAGLCRSSIRSVALGGVRPVPPLRPRDQLHGRGNPAFPAFLERKRIPAFNTSTPSENAPYPGRMKPRRNRALARLIQGLSVAHIIPSQARKPVSPAPMIGGGEQSERGMILRPEPPKGGRKAHAVSTGRGKQH